MGPGPPGPHSEDCQGVYVHTCHCSQARDSCRISIRFTAPARRNFSRAMAVDSNCHFSNAIETWLEGVTMGGSDSMHHTAPMIIHHAMG